MRIRRLAVLGSAVLLHHLGCPRALPRVLLSGPLPIARLAFAHNATGGSTGMSQRWLRNLMASHRSIGLVWFPFRRVSPCLVATLLATCCPAAEVPLSPLSFSNRRVDDLLFLFLLSTFGRTPFPADFRFWALD